MSRRHTGDNCLRCETQGRVPNKGTISVVYGPFEGFIYTECLAELEEENAISYARTVDEN